MRLLIDLLWLEAGFVLNVWVVCWRCLWAGKFVVCLIMLFIDCGLGIWVLILYWFGWVGFDCGHCLGLVWVWLCLFLSGLSDWCC